MIESAIDNWLRWAAGELEGDRLERLHELLSDDVTFYSPVVFTPQKGKTATALYLMAAFGTFSKSPSEESLSQKDPNAKDGFRYTKKLFSDRHAVLEFETNMGGKYVNGVDIITCNDAGLITDFKVMIRPLQAVNMVHAQMAGMLKKMQNGD